MLSNTIPDTVREPASDIGRAEERLAMDVSRRSSVAFSPTIKRTPALKCALKARAVCQTAEAVGGAAASGTNGRQLDCELRESWRRGA
jgi:hypothetical protein